jgi:hypothetical protein
VLIARRRQVAAKKLAAPLFLQFSGYGKLKGDGLKIERTHPLRDTPPFFSGLAF